MMIAGVISREYGDPWPPHHMSSALWLHQPYASFPINTLTATQPGVTFASLLTDALPYGGDPLPHVVIHAGTHYLEDGHHRMMRAILNGETALICRWIEL